MPERTAPLLPPGLTLDALRELWRDGAPVAALLVGKVADMSVVDALTGALRRHGINPLPLDTGGSDDGATALLARFPPDVVLDGSKTTRHFECPVLPVVLPESGAAAECIEFIAALAAHWAKLRRTPPAQRRLALVLAGRPDAARAVAAVAALHALAAAGYRVDDPPPDGAALLTRLRVGGWREAQETLLLPDYFAVFHSLPSVLQENVMARWGAPERDASFQKGELHCGEFTLRALRFGNVSVALQPYDGGEAVPQHGYLAFHAWLQDGLRADAVVYVDHAGDGRAGDAVPLAGDCHSRAALGPLPHVFLDEEGPSPRTSFLRDLGLVRG